MVLTKFPVFVDETRLIKHNHCLYKVKLVYKNISLDNILDRERVSAAVQAELEEILRAVLHMVLSGEQLVLLRSQNFYVSPTLKIWKAQQKLGFRENGKDLKVYENVIILVLTPHFAGEIWREKNAQVNRGQVSVCTQESEQANASPKSQTSRSPKSAASVSKNTQRTPVRQTRSKATSDTKTRSVAHQVESLRSKRVRTQTDVPANLEVGYSLRNHRPQRGTMQLRNTSLRYGNQNNSNNRTITGPLSRKHQQRHTPELQYLEDAHSNRRTAEAETGTSSSKSVQQSSKNIARSPHEATLSKQVSHQQKSSSSIARSQRATLQQNRARLQQDCSCVLLRASIAQEDQRLRNLSMITHSSAGRFTAHTFQQKDYRLIAQENMREELKLQQLASTEQGPNDESVVQGRKRKRSLIQMVADSVVTPIKRVLGQGKTRRS